MAQCIAFPGRNSQSMFFFFFFFFFCCHVLFKSNALSTHLMLIDQSDSFREEEKETQAQLLGSFPSPHGLILITRS
jgi:hypothetical protein